jgi:hypothetical protein
MASNANETKITLQVGSQLRIKSIADIVIDNPDRELVGDDNAADAMVTYRFDPKAGDYVLLLVDPVMNHRHIKIHRRND